MNLASVEVSNLDLGHVKQDEVYLTTQPLHATIGIVLLITVMQTSEAKIP
jgi:hypothetical protein